MTLPQLFSTDLISISSPQWNLHQGNFQVTSAHLNSHESDISSSSLTENKIFAQRIKMMMPTAERKQRLTF